MSLSIIIHFDKDCFHDTPVIPCTSVSFLLSVNLYGSWKPVSLMLLHRSLYINYSHLIQLLMFLYAFGLLNVTGIRVSEGNFSMGSIDLGGITSNEVTSSMPDDMDQIKTWMATYAPLVYFHPDEQYFPSSMNWFFDNGALLYQQGNESHPVRIDTIGSNLPQGGTNDGAFWIDLPVENNDKERTMKGDLESAKGYLHVKSMQGGTVTDLAIWLFYPYNGPAKAKVEFMNIKLGRIGSHVGDWEHVTLRINNLDGKLQSVYFAQHGSGQWVNASDLEYINGTKPVAYASHNGHAMYPHAGLVLQGNSHIGIRNDMARSEFVMDIGAKFEIVSAEKLGIIEPPWLNYFREWGPKVNYNLADEINKVKKVLIFKKLKRAFEKFVNGLPSEVLGQEGPTGPKEKPSWNGDERA